jgi:hypothetical protein
VSATVAAARALDGAVTKHPRCSAIITVCWFTQRNLGGSQTRNSNEALVQDNAKLKVCVERLRRLVCFCLAIIITAPTAALSAELAWELDQKHVFFGPLTIHMSQHGICVDQSRFSSVYMRRNGESTSYIYNTADKVLYVGNSHSASEMSRVMVLAGLSTRHGDLFDWKEIPFKKVKSGMMFGMPSELYVANKGIYRWEIWITKAFNMPAWLYAEHENCARLPQIDGMPLRATLFNTTKTGSSDLITTLAVRKIKPSQVNLTIPPGLKRVNNVTDVVSSQTSSFIQDVQETLGK